MRAVYDSIEMDETEVRPYIRAQEAWAAGYAGPLAAWWEAHDASEAQRGREDPTG